MKEGGTMKEGGYHDYVGGGYHEGGGTMKVKEVP